MNQEQVQEILNYLDPALIEEAERPRRGRMFRPVRIGLIAACLCVALVGTVTAVRLVGGFNSLELFEGWIFDDHPEGEVYYEGPYDGYTVKGGMAYVPLSDLPQEVLDLAAENPGSTVKVDLNDWEEAEVYFALDLPGNAYMEGLERKSFRACLSSDSEGPTALDCTAIYRDGGTQLKVRVTSYTERMKLDGYEAYYGWLYPSDVEFTTEERTYDNGLSALVTTAEMTPEYTITGGIEYRADFSLSGVWYSVQVTNKTDPQAALMALETLLGSFAL